MTTQLRASTFRSTPSILVIAIDPTPSSNQDVASLVFHLTSYTDVRRVDNPRHASLLLSSDIRFGVVVITESRFLHPENADLHNSLSSFTRAGGTLIFCGMLVIEIWKMTGKRSLFQNLMRKNFDLEWEVAQTDKHEMSSHSSFNMALSLEAAPFFLGTAKPRLSAAYYRDSVRLLGVKEDCQVYTSPPVKPRPETTSAITMERCGRGWVGWMGFEFGKKKKDAIELLIRMCGLRGFAVERDLKLVDSQIRSKEVALLQPPPIFGPINKPGSEVAWQIPIFGQAKKSYETDGCGETTSSNDRLPPSTTTKPPNLTANSKALDNVSVSSKSATEADLDLFEATSGGGEARGVTIKIPMTTAGKATQTPAKSSTTSDLTSPAPTWWNAKHLDLPVSTTTGKFLRESESVDSVAGLTHGPPDYEHEPHPLKRRRSEEREEEHRKRRSPHPYL